MRYAALIALAALAGCGGDDEEAAATPVDTMKRARLTSGPYIEIDFTLVKTDDRWLIDDSDAVPNGD